MLPVYFTNLVYNDSGLVKASEILRRNMQGTLISLGKTLRTSAQRYMREDRGKTKKSLIIRIEKGGGLDATLLVYSTLVQAFVDAFGMSAGTFPNSRRYSPLWNWAKRKYEGKLSKEVKTFSRRRIRQGRNDKQNLKRIHRVSNVAVPAKTKDISKAKLRDIDRLTFVFARHIYERGIKPTHWNKRALDSNRFAIIRDIKVTLERSVAEINRGG